MKKIFAILILLSSSAYASQIELRDWVPSPFNECLKAQMSQFLSTWEDDVLEFMEYKPRDNSPVKTVNGTFLTKRYRVYVLALEAKEKWMPIIEENNTKLGFKTAAINSVSFVRELGSNNVIGSIDVSECAAE